ncbi:MAG: hypothetical protein QOF54_300, partial [Solirubrobacteraceae bacterium]|nr:hypothetical protein [Solirubrobacteraceae bacterium]
TLCGESTLAVGSLLALVHGRPDLRPKLAIVGKLAIAGAPAVLVALLPDLSSLVRALLAVLVYCVLLVLTRALPAELIELLPARLRGGGPSSNVG